MGFNFDLKRFKKVHTDKHSTTLAHPDGHKITIAHSALSPKMRGQLAELPTAMPTKMADGGNVADNNEDEENSNPVASALSKFDDGGQVQNDAKASAEIEANSNELYRMTRGEQGRAPKVTNEEQRQGISDYFNGKPAPKKNYDEGGDVKAQDQAYLARKYPKIDNDEGTNKQAPSANVTGSKAEAPRKTNAEQKQSMVDAANGMADGGEVAMPDSPDQIVADAMASQPQQAPAPMDQNQAMANAVSNSLSNSLSSLTAPSADGKDFDQTIGTRANNMPQAPSTPVPQAMASAPAPEQQAPQSAPAGDPYGNQAYSNAYMRGLNEQKAGLNQAAAAEGAQGEQEALALQKHINDAQALQNNFQSHNQALEAERQGFMQDISKNLIDPNHYMNDMSTAGKVKTTIGLILGGMGAGLTGGENLGYRMLQDNINRDIAGQQHNLGARENLLNANLKQFGNLRDATDMTRIMQSDIVSTELKKAAANTMNPMAKARALQVAGQLDQQAAPVLSQIAMRKTLLNGMSAGQVPPSSVIRMIVPEPHQAAAYKELSQAENMVKIRDSLMGAFDQVAKINTMGNKLANPLQSGKQADAITGPLIEQLAKDNEGRVTPTTVQYLKTLMPAVGDSSETQMIKRVKLNQFVSNKMNFPILQSYGINMGDKGRYTNQGQKKLQLGPPKR